VRRLLGVLPLSMLAVACGVRPWTPSVSVAFWAEDVPAGREVAMPSSAELGQAWTLPAGDPWAPYTKLTLASAVDPLGDLAVLPDVRSLDVVAKAQAAASHVARVGLPASTLWIVDMRGAASCAFGATLSREAREPISPVATFNNWPAEDSLVPADETLAGMLAFTPKLPREGDGAASSTPVFLLDSWRLAFRFDDPGDDVYDNRYILTQADLPDAATLRARGITRVVYVVEDLDDAEVEEDDLHASFRAWQTAGLPIFMVDLDFLADVPAPQGGEWRTAWAARLQPEAYAVNERYTLLDDPVFYLRARGGFGLARGRPVIVSGRGFGGGRSLHGSGG
jgi:hypothetical protein